jgi:hypothetical protein
MRARGCVKRTRQRGKRVAGGACMRACVCVGHAPPSPQSAPRRPPPSSRDWQHRQRAKQGHAREEERGGRVCGDSASVARRMRARVCEQRGGACGRCARRHTDAARRPRRGRGKRALTAAACAHAAVRAARAPPPAQARHARRTAWPARRPSSLAACRRRRSCGGGRGAQGGKTPNTAHKKRTRVSGAVCPGATAHAAQRRARTQGGCRRP